MLWSCTMKGNIMLLHSYSAAFHAALLQVVKEICKHVRRATCVNAEEITQRNTKWKKRKKKKVGKIFVGADSITYDCYTQISFCFWCENRWLNMTTQNTSFLLVCKDLTLINFGKLYRVLLKLSKRTCAT